MPLTLRTWATRRPCTSALQARTALRPRANTWTVCAQFCSMIGVQQRSAAAAWGSRAPRSVLPRRRGRACAAAAAGGAKRALAEAAIDKFVASNSVVALGSGDVVYAAIAYLGSCLMDKKLEGVTAVPVSGAAAHEAAFHGVPLTTLEDAQQVAVLIDQVDQIDLSSSAALKGIRAEPQQPDLPRLRLALAAAEKVVLLAEPQDAVPRLSASLPVVVDGADWEQPAEALDDIFLGDAEIWRRPSSGVANPRGGDNPYVSPAGDNIVDVRFYEGMKLFGEDAKYEAIAAEIDGIEGVVTHGLLLNVADAVLLADADGNVRVLEPKKAAAAAPSS